jgi:ElaB/YqjD/DUF883 family membrane-anchored ribosome-binding protein
VGTHTAEVRQDIAETRSELASDLHALNEKVNPQQVYARKMERTKGRLQHAKERVMGAKQNAASSASGSMHTAEQTVEQKTEGHPLLAGALAFGTGWLLSSVLPSTKVEQQAGSQLKDRAEQHKDTVKQELQSVAGDLKTEAKSDAKQAASQVKSEAQQSAQHVSDQAKDAGQQVGSQARSAAQDTSHEAKDAAKRVQSQSAQQ